MSLQPGTKLGPYEILAQIGAGGMGEVYKAADARLNRTVAVKILPQHFSEQPEMKQRFVREAQTIAGLNHPNICTVYDVGRQDGIDFIVMEYLEGETLAQRLGRGALPFDDTLRVAIAIADALDKAHGQGVTHRDLKPGNIMLTPSGAKLLDFGLAKLAHPAPSAGSMTASGVNKTAPGTILGTLQYMAPEQLEGQEADARTDIFAFGAVLYETLTGRKAFEGRSQALLIASIVSFNPEPPSKSQPKVPAALDYLVKRCLAKDPEQRLQTACDLVAQLQWIAGGGADLAAMPLPAAAPRRRTATPARAALAIVLLVVAALAILAFRSFQSPPVGEETRFLVSVPDMPVPEAVSISPDGRWIAYSGRDTASTSVFVRPMGSEASQKLVGTEGAGRLFWSPDSRWIAFFAGGTLKRVEAIGGPPQSICETADLLGGAWNAEGVIVFASSKGLQRVLAAGGEPTPIEIAASGEAGDNADSAGSPPQSGNTPREPFFLPDGRHFLYLAGAAIFAGELDSNETTRLVTAESNAAYAEPGYLLFHREGTLYAQSFDPDSLELSGEAIRIADKIPYSTTGAAAFSASQTGVLLFRNNPQLQAGAAATGAILNAPLVWVDRSGTRIEQAAAPAGWAGLNLSPDGKWTAVHRHDGNGGDIWNFEAGSDTPSRFTFDATQDNSMPVWSPDGRRIAFASRRNGKWGLYVKIADNTRAEELVIESELATMPMSWSNDRLVYWTSDPKTAGDVWSVALSPAAGDKNASPVLETPADERNPQVSPDGKWLAYSSNESGRSEIYIRPFPEGPGKIQVSVNGGVFPRWRGDGRELYFLSLVSLGAMMQSEIRVAGSSVQRDVPRMLFQPINVNGFHSAGPYHAYAVSGNGQRFLIPQFANLQSIPGVGGGGGGATTTAAIASVLPAVLADRNAAASSSGTSAAPITVVFNWTSALKGN